MAFGLNTSKLDDLFDEKNSKNVNLQSICKDLNTSIDKGILGSDDDIHSRTEVFGENINPEPKFTSFFELLIDAVQGDATVIILVIAAFVSLALGFLATADDPSEQYGCIEGLAILAAVFIVSFVTAINDYSKEIQFRKLNKVKENKSVRVLRNGHPATIGAFNLVVGDIVILDTGDAIPADGILIEGFNLVVNQSALTGEAKNIPKSPNSSPFLFAGTQVVEGVGKMIVCRVGPHSEWGKTIAQLATEPDPTPLQEKLETVANIIGYIGLGAAILTFAAQTTHWLYDIYYNPDTGDDIWERAADLVGFLITAITIVVVAVPEGLPLAVTISLAYSMSKMMKDNNLVRKLEACETMGGATDICSDKTGTLTQNKMTVVDCWMAGKRFNGINEISNINNSVSSSIIENFCNNISINSTANITADNTFIGNQTDCAILMMVRNQLNHDFTSTRLSANVYRVDSFSSERKCSSVLVESSNNNSVIVYTKGAAEIVLNMCTRILDGDNERNITNSDKAKLLEMINEMSGRGLRVLCVAYKSIDNENGQRLRKNSTILLEENLCCIAFVGIQDPLRPEAKDAVRQCQDAGLIVRMVTGDNINTAKAIAREAGILTNGNCMEGSEFRKIPEDELPSIIPSLQVLARSSPTDKYILVKALKKMRRVCCVTGDGTNDAPALKKADVGLSMGLCGTEVAKEASDIVLLDDNFASIVKSISWGRCVYDNIRKFLQFQLTVNLVALTTAFVSALCEYGTPLTAVQLLWVNLIMDTLAALALATEPPSPDSLKRKPYGRDDNIISKTMWRNIFCQGIFQLILQYFVLVHGPSFFNIEAHSILHHTLSFNVFVFCQIFNEFNSRRVGNENDVFSGLFNNMMFVSIVALTIIVQVLFIEFGGSYTQTVPLPTNLWLFTILSSSFSIPFGFIYRLIPVGGSDNDKKEKRD